MSSALSDERLAPASVVTFGSEKLYCDSNLEGQVPRIYIPEEQGPSYTPRHWIRFS
jgi:hypothetical protein